MQTIIAYLLAEANDVAAESEAPEIRPWLILAGAFLVISYVMLRNLRQKVAKSHAHDRMSIAERVAQTKPERHLHDQITELMAELADLSRQINGQLDTRMARLEILLARADQAIVNLSGEPLPTRDDRPPATRPVAERVTPDNQSPPPHARQSPRLTAQERTILEMAERGMTGTQISQELGRPVGEVELILALKQHPRGQ